MAGIRENLKGRSIFGLLFCSYRDGDSMCLRRYRVITCNARVTGTAIVGIRIPGIVVIVDTPKSGDVINPRLTAITKSTIPNTFQTMRAYFTQYAP